jgi:hypothetical protein
MYRPTVGKRGTEFHDTCPDGYRTLKILHVSGTGAYALSELDEIWLRTLA